MGVVYRARQVSLNRDVAVKMLLFGEFSSPEFVRRFRMEAEAAASLQHPNIVAIHEIGEHEGQHYFSMDLIEGQTLAELIRHKPVPARRAALMVKTIAEAVDYAHQRGVLHRDLKPSNVLIDAAARPHITDFGLAKLLKADGERTATGDVLGSPSFMPPEQADRQRAVVGRHSDIYSLGAILYNLLTGRPPFMAETVKETLLQVLEKEPVSPRLLNASVPRDLETICLKCLCKEPLARYPTAADLAQELERWLSGQPIRARPASLPGKIWRWSTRQPALAAMAATVILLLLTVAFGSTFMFAKEKRARLNEATLRLQAQAAEKKALSAANNSQQVSSLLEHILQSMGPATPIATRERILSLAEERLKKDVTGQAETRLELTLALADVCHDSGLFARMEELAREALRLSRESYPEPHPEIARALVLLANACIHLLKLEEAESASRQAIAMQEQMGGEDTADLIHALNTLGSVLQRQQKLDEAERTFRHALEISENSGQNQKPEHAWLLENLAHVLRDKFNFHAAEVLFRQALDLRRKVLGEEHPDVATSLHNLARVMYDQGRYAEAENCFADTLSRRRKLLGEEHPAVATSLYGLGLVYDAEGRCAEAEQVFSNSLSIRRKVYGEGHRAVAESRASLAAVLRDQNKLNEADALLTGTSKP
jgi:tetratricopeptide (TPR) repeat protein